MTPEKIFELNQATLNQEASLSDNHHRLNLKETIRSLDRSLEQLAEKIPHAILKALSKLPDHLNLNQLYKYSPYLILALLSVYSLKAFTDTATVTANPLGTDSPISAFEPTQIYPEPALSSYQPPPPPTPPALSLENGSVGLNIEFNEPGWSKYLIPDLPIILDAYWDIKADSKFEKNKWSTYWRERLDSFRPAVINIVGPTPRQYRREINGSLAPSCALPKPEYYKQFADFINNVIEEYQPDAVEIWNEPDIWLMEKWPYTIGCYITGEQYGQLIKTIYPLINKEHPQTMIIAGALAGDDEKWIKDFFGSVTDKNGEQPFDGFSFHVYSIYQGDFDLILQRASNLRKFTNKPLIVTETGLLCDGNEKVCQSREFSHEQARYAKYLLELINQDLFYDIFMYTLQNNWRYTGLVQQGKATQAWCELYRRQVGIPSRYCVPQRDPRSYIID